MAKNVWDLPDMSVQPEVEQAGPPSSNKKFEATKKKLHEMNDAERLAFNKKAYASGEAEAQKQNLKGLRGEEREEEIEKGIRWGKQKEIAEDRIERIPVSSSHIASIGYHPVRKIMEVEFKSGPVYRYHGVEADTHKKFMESESKGKHFNENFRNTIHHGRVE